jgi:hypothetical protein
LAAASLIEVQPVMHIAKILNMQRRPKKAKMGPELKKRRPDDRFTRCASTGPVQNKKVLKSRLDWNKAKMRDIGRGILDEHGGHLRNRNEWWRKDPRSIPKVFLIDACEVS